MIKLKIVGNSIEAQKAIKTNRPLKKGQLYYSGNEFALKTLAQAHPDLFEVVEGNFKPTSNKMLKKEDIKGFKTKSDKTIVKKASTKKIVIKKKSIKNWD